MPSACSSKNGRRTVILRRRFTGYPSTWEEKCVQVWFCAFVKPNTSIQFGAKGKLWGRRWVIPEWHQRRKGSTKIWTYRRSGRCICWSMKQSVFLPILNALWILQSKTYTLHFEFNNAFNWTFWENVCWSSAYHLAAKSSIEGIREIQSWSLRK